MKKFNVKRLLSLIVLSLAVAAYSFAQEKEGFVTVKPGSKEGLISIGIGKNLGTKYDKYVVENRTKENVVLYVFENGKDKAATTTLDIQPNASFSLPKNKFITPWPEAAKGFWGFISFWINDIKERDRNGYYIEKVAIDGGKTCKYTVYKGKLK